MRSLSVASLAFMGVIFFSNAETKIGKIPSEWMENLSVLQATWKYDEKGIYLYHLSPPLSLLVNTHYFDKAELWDALNDSKRFIPTHVLLTLRKYSGEHIPRSFEKWNGLPIVIHSDGTAFTDADQQAVIDLWRDDLQ